MTVFLSGILTVCGALLVYGALRGAESGDAEKGERIAALSLQRAELIEERDKLQSRLGVIRGERDRAMDLANKMRINIDQLRESNGSLSESLSETADKANHFEARTKVLSGENKVLSEEADRATDRRDSAIAALQAAHDQMVALVRDVEEELSK